MMANSFLDSSYLLFVNIEAFAHTPSLVAHPQLCILVLPHWIKKTARDCFHSLCNKAHPVNYTGHFGPRDPTEKMW